MAFKHLPDSHPKTLRPLSSLAIAGTLAISTFFLNTATAKAEGSAQLGINQPIYEYGISFTTANTGIFSPNHAIYVDIVAANEVINVSLCGIENADDVRVEIYDTLPNISDPTLVPSTGSQAFAQTLANSNVDCADGMTGTLTTPLQFTAPTPGTYEVRLFNDGLNGDGSTRDILNRVDVTVTPTATTPVDPTAALGRAYSYSWAFNAGGFGTAEAADTDYFIKVPGGRPGENFVWRLDLNNFAGFIYEIIANNLGLEPPNQGLSDDFTDANTGLANDINPLFPLYLAHPAVTGIRPNVPPEVVNFQFTDSDGQDNSISPGSTGGVQDSGTFSFNTDISGTAVVIIDADQDGLYAPGDTYLFAEVTPGSNSIVWDGTDNNNTVLPEGSYTAQLQVRMGEFHFVASDAETSGGTQPGLTVFESLGPGIDQDTLVFWDDFTKLSGAGGTSTLPNGNPSSSPAARHTWGNNTGSGFGNRRFIDTYVFGNDTTVTSAAIIGPTDDPVARDYGDAPDTAPGGTDNTNYETTEANGGPNHIITAGLQIGAAPDADDGTQQNEAADADDTSGNDEGDIVLPTLLAADAAYTLSNIAVTNTTGGDAFLTGWIDFDQSGTFDNDERAIATISDSQTTADLEWSATATNPIPADTANGTTYARFRLSSTDDLGPLGGAIDGEVEDYSLTVVALPLVRLVKRLTAINRGAANEQLFDASYVDVTDDDNDNAINWLGDPVAENFGSGTGTVESYLPGVTGITAVLSAVENTAVIPEDVLEYTISFLSDGYAYAENTYLCDLIPPNTVFEHSAFNSAAPAAPSTSNRGIFISFDGSDVALTNENDGDEILETGGNDNGIGGYYFPPSVDPSVALGTSINCSGTNNNGVVVVDLSDLPNATDQGTPTNSFGYIRFNVRVR